MTAAGIADRQQISAQQRSDCLRVGTVVLDLGFVDGLHVESMSQNERDAGIFAHIGHHIPVERALAGHGQIVPVRSNQLQKTFLIMRFDVFMQQLVTRLVHDAQIHVFRVQIDSAVELSPRLM